MATSNPNPQPTALASAHIRIARPTDNIAALHPFYITGLGFEVLFEFKGHQGFDGVMFGLESAGYHLEFTQQAGHAAGKAPSEENLLVFYLPNEDVWNAAVTRMEKAGFPPVRAWNPYWDVSGRTFEDPDGYRVVLQCAGWENGSARRRFLESEK